MHFPLYKTQDIVYAMKPRPMICERTQEAFLQEGGKEYQAFSKKKQILEAHYILCSNRLQGGKDSIFCVLTP